MCFLLVDALEKNRNRCPENHGLYHSHYLGAPASSWDEMLTMTKFELQSWTKCLR